MWEIFFLFYATRRALTRKTLLRSRCLVKEFWLLAGNSQFRRIKLFPFAIKSNDAKALRGAIKIPTQLQFRGLTSEE